MNEVREALESAAEAGDPAVAGGFAAGRRATSSPRRENSVRTAIVRFLENLPDDMTVIEIREKIEEEE